MIVKIGPVDPEIALLNLKKKKLTQAKYIARSAGLPSGLNYIFLLMMQRFIFTFKNLADKDNLQIGIENLVDWTNRWQVSLYINECKIMSVHHRKYFNMGVVPNYDINNIS